MLWQNVEHFVVQSDLATTGTMDDFVALKGQSVALGNKNSGTIGSNAAILGGFGLDIDTDFSLVYGGYGPAAEALQNGQVAGISDPRRCAGRRAEPAVRLCRRQRAPC